jgi:hypothetical protein
MRTIWNALAQLNFRARRNLRRKASSVRTRRFVSAGTNERIRGTHKQENREQHRNKTQIRNMQSVTT